MNQKTLSAIPIVQKDLEKVFKDASGFLKSVSWSVTPDVSKDDPSYHQKRLQKTEVSVSISKSIHDIDPSDDLLSDEQLHLLRAIRGGAQVALHVAKDYGKRAGIPKKMPVGTTETQKTEIREKEQTAAAIALFVMARYIIWDTQSLISDNAFLKNINVHLDEVELSRIVPALRCATFFLGRNIDSESHNDDARLIATVYKFAELLQQDILNRSGSLKHVVPFSDITYQLEDSDFAISGFALIDMASTATVEFNRLELKSIVGNRDAKHFMRMDAKRRACYDFLVQKNPFLELGGITQTFLGKGIPGTGKSMLIAAYATMLSDLCEVLNIPFLFHPLPDNIIDSFQGNSAKNMISWMQPLQDPTRIVWAPIDDAENILENRLHQGVSEGVKAAIGVFLRYTEGAYAINRGNSAIGIFTNLPENLDPAVLSRIQARFAIDGARTEEDFLDQDHLWWSKIEESEAGFVGMKKPLNYEWYAKQGNLTSLSEISESRAHPKESKILAAFHNTLEEAQPDEHAFFAKYYMSVQKEYSYFSSRDVRNIQAAINLRIMDFDLPDEWFYEGPDIFIAKDYDTKLSMILELRKANMKGLNFAEIRMEETNNYLDNMAQIADAEFQRKVEAGINKQRELAAIQSAMERK